METKNERSSSSIPMGETAQEKGFSYVPECYKVQSPELDVPLVDLEGMSNPARRAVIVEEIGDACRRNGFFQVINHGISELILEAAIRTAADFFDLPTQAKAKYMSNDVHTPVRYGTSLKDGAVQYWRVFLKHYAHPLKNWVGLWPDTPPDYREKMGENVVEVQKLALKIMGFITESLGLGPTYLSNKLDDGMQVITVNSYPPCPQPNQTLGLPPHTDYCCLTIVLQDTTGLQILDYMDKSWKTIPIVRTALQVHVSDQLEILSNGRYKSVVHRVVLNSENTRYSVANLHSLGMDVKMAAAEEMVDEENPNGYKESCFKDFLNYISRNDIGEGISFLETLKIRE